MKRIKYQIGKWIFEQLKRHCPEHFADREDMMRAAKELGNKLRDSKKECEEWRQRAFSAENVIRNTSAALHHEADTHKRKTGGLCGFW